MPQGTLMPTEEGSPHRSAMVGVKTKLKASPALPCVFSRLSTDRQGRYGSMVASSPHDKAEKTEGLATLIRMNAAFSMGIRR